METPEEKSGLQQQKERLEQKLKDLPKTETKAIARATLHLKEVEAALAKEKEQQPSKEVRQPRG